MEKRSLRLNKDHKKEHTSASSNSMRTVRIGRQTRNISWPSISAIQQVSAQNKCIRRSRPNKTPLGNRRKDDTDFIHLTNGFDLAMCIIGWSLVWVQWIILISDEVFWDGYALLFLWIVLNAWFMTLTPPLGPSWSFLSTLQKYSFITTDAPLFRQLFYLICCINAKHSIYIQPTSTDGISGKHFQVILPQQIQMYHENKDTR